MKNERQIPERINQREVARKRINQREVARSLVMFYRETKTKRDFLLKVSQVFDFACIDEARLVWDAIDEYVSSVNPSE